MSRLRLCVQGAGALVWLASPASHAAEPSSADPAFAMVTVGGDISGRCETASGLADADARRELTGDTPFRIASNTKTFVAATVLRLWEQARIALDAPIGPLLSPELNELLRGDGYATDKITVRHLLSHSAGLYDHGGDPRFTARIMGDPDHRWTRAELVRLAVEWADPQSPPGTEFRYSDTGYILLGDIIERLTKQSLAGAVRDQLRLNSLNLTNSWWEIMEAPRGNAHPRARQWLGEREATQLHASMDLYGGGGLVMSPRDLATFTAALFGGKVFDRPSTLQEMLRQGAHRGGNEYRLGIFVKELNGREVYWHSGFWGTIVYYRPDNGLAVAGMTTNQKDFPKLREKVERQLSDPMCVKTDGAR